MSYRIVSLLVLAAVLLGLSACEVTDPLQDVELILDVEDVPVDLGGGVAVQVSPEQPAVAEQTVSNDLEVATVEEIRQIRIEPEDLHFAAGAAKASGVRATGTLQVYVFLGGVPLPNMPVTVEIVDSQVTSVAPSAINFLGTTYDVDVAGVNEFLDALPPGQRPNLKDWENLTIDQVRTELNAALSASSIPVAIGSRVVSSAPNDPLTGSLVVQELGVDARVTK